MNEAFFIVKGLLSLTAALLFVYHMLTAWDRTVSTGQRFRYYSLLAYSFTIAYSSAELGIDHVVPEGRHYLTLVVTVLVLITAIICIREDRNVERRKH